MCLPAISQSIRCGYGYDGTEEIILRRQENRERLAVFYQPASYMAMLPLARTRSNAHARAHTEAHAQTG